MTESEGSSQPDPTPGEPTPGRQPELDLGMVPTGDPRVDAALLPLDGLPDRPVDEHPAVFEAVHQRLHEALADVPDPSG